MACSDVSTLASANWIGFQGRHQSCFPRWLPLEWYACLEKKTVWNASQSYSITKDERELGLFAQMSSGTKIKRISASEGSMGGRKWGEIENREMGDSPQSPTAHCSEKGESPLSAKSCLPLCVQSLQGRFPARGHSYYFSAHSREKLNLISSPELCTKIDWSISQILTKHLLFTRQYGGHPSPLRRKAVAFIQERKGPGSSDIEQRTDLGDINQVGLVPFGDGLNVEEKEGDC